MTTSTERTTTERRVSSRGHEIAYDVSGSGSPVVLVPGFLMGRVRWTETGTVAALAERHQVVSVDPLGFGDSSRPHDPSQYDAAGLAADLVAVLDAEGIESAHLWGYSRGTGLVADVACLHPGRVRSLVVGGAPIHVPRSALPPNPDFVAALRSGDWERAWALFGIPLPDDIKTTMEARNDPAAAAAAHAGLVQDVDRSRIDCPVMEYVGGGEWFWEVVRDEAEANGARLEVIGDLGHAETFQATGIVVPLVEDFLASV